MSFRSLLTQTLTVRLREPTGKDVYNNDVLVVTETYETPGLIQQAKAEEVTVDRGTFTSDSLAFLPPGVRLDANSQISLGGLTYEVLGPPNRLWNPRTKREHHVEAKLRLTTG